MPKFRAFDVAIIALCAAVYAVIGYLTSFGLSFGGVAFWPAAFVPAIFAVLFGPWEGGTGAAIGIFIRDIIVIGQPLLSFTVGVPANFAAFFLIGYFAHTKLDRKKTLLSLIIGTGVILAGLLLPTVFLQSVSAELHRIVNRNHRYPFQCRHGGVLNSVCSYRKILERIQKFWGRFNYRNGSGRFDNSIWSLGI